VARYPFPTEITGSCAGSSSMAEFEKLWTRCFDMMNNIILDKATCNQFTLSISSRFFGLQCGLC